MCAFKASRKALYHAAIERIELGRGSLHIAIAVYLLTKR
jgi:hypothetical protein